MRYRERAICLRASDYSETSQIVHFLTREAGRVRLLAKGSKRPKSKTGGAMDLMSEGELIFTTSGSGGLGTLIEFAEDVSHTDVRRDARRVFVASYMLELADNMIGEQDPHPEVFDLLHNALVRLGQADAPTPAVLAYYQWRLLRRTGLLGELRLCAACGRLVEAVGPADLIAGANKARHEPGGDIYFSSRLGGLVCAACEGATPEKYRLDQPTLDGLAIVQAAEAGRKVTLPDGPADALNRLLAYHIREQLGKPLKTARYALKR
jgi:DNA repair protein RecO (recombination protein O)